ncbi:N-acetyltransferase family protein [Ralstonia pseudosolanacearum]
MTTTPAERATFTLRSATPDDCAALVRLIGALAEYEKLTHLMQATPAALRTMLFGPRPYGEAVVAEVEGRAVGFALFFHNVSTFLCKPGLYLEDLFVEPAWRGHGIGKALLVHVARLARERDCGRFEWSVLDWNAPSIAFYEAMGADVLPDWRICRTTGDALARMAALPMPAGLAAPN